MEAMTLHRSASSMFGISNSVSGLGFPTVKRPHFVQFGVRFGFSKGHTSVSTMKHGNRRVALGSRRGMVVRSSLSSEPEGSSGPIAPLQLESPVGQFLSQILMSHPHLVPAAVDKQLEQLQTDRDADKQQDVPSASGTDLVLYRRIAKIKANERKTALEEILYALVVQKFMDSSVSLVPTINPDPSGLVATWPSQDKQLEQLHSTEAYEMIQNHLSLILGNRIGDSTSVAQISKIRAGQVYAASVMYGYFLKRVDQRFQLEKTMKNLPLVSPEEEEYNLQQALGEEIRPRGTQAEISTTPFTGMGPDGFSQRIKSSRLRSYVMSFDGDTLQRYATIRSREAVSIIEKHTEALFGRPEIAITPQGTIDSSQDELIKISFGGLKRLVLEAVTFGSFLWEVESYVDSRYHFVAS